MRLSQNQHLFGYPALQIRRLMRLCQDYRWSIGIVASTLSISRDCATELVEAMLADDLIAESLDHRSPKTTWGMIGEDSHVPRYELAMKGRALAMASAKPIRRSTAERLVSELLKRVADVNSDPHFLFWIEEVLVFGSFLTPTEMLGDVDLGLTYMRRTNDPEEFDKLRKERVKEAQAAGRHFPRFFDRVSWPMREVELTLRNRCGSLSLHNLCDEREFIQALPHRQIYLRNTSTLPSGALPIITIG